MILKSESSSVQITILNRRISYDSNDYWDNNWIKSEIKINTQIFRGTYSTNLRTDDFQRFYKDLSDLSKDEIQDIEFTTMEEGLFLNGKLDYTGNFKWNVIAKPEAGYRLSFPMVTDNYSIRILMNEVLKILDAYPVIGNIL